MSVRRVGRSGFTAGLALLIAASSAAADTLKVPSQYGTIAGAALAAGEGDTILVAAGTYYETITLAVPGVTLKGAGKCVLDARKDGEPHGPGITVTAADVTISSLTVRHAEGMVSANGYGILSSAPGTTLEHVRVFGCQNIGLYSSGADLVVRGCTFESCRNFGVYASASNALIESTTVRQMPKVGIRVEGAGNVVRKCRLEQMSVHGIQAFGAQAVVESCTFDGVGDTGILVAADGVTLSKNRFRTGGVWAAMYFQDAVGGLVDGNTCEGLTRFGTFLTNCSGISLTGNTFERVGGMDGAAILIQVSDNCMLSGNTILDAGGDGISIDGDANIIVGNKISSCTTDGIDITGGDGNVVQGNTLTSNLGEGLDNGGGATDCLGNKFSKNRIDVAGAGTFGLFNGNIYATGGPGQLPQVE